MENSVRPIAKDSEKSIRPMAERDEKKLVPHAILNQAHAPDYFGWSLGIH